MAHTETQITPSAVPQQSVATWDRDRLQARLDELKREFGEWTYDIPLPHGVWTKGNTGIPHTRLKRVVQIVSDVTPKPLSQCRVLDLGCLDGIFSIEFASQGAETIGVEVREANVKKAEFCRDALALKNLRFVQEDVRKVSLAAYGKFDAILCSGILYHLPAQDAARLVETLFEMTGKTLIVDTRIAARAEQRFSFAGAEYWGQSIQEHSEQDSQEKKAGKLLASWDNTSSFYFTRPSLVNLLSRTGFSSVYECFVPAHLNYGKPGIECATRCTFVALKGSARQLHTSPAANPLREYFPEETLAYSPDAVSKLRRKGPVARIKKLMRNMKGGQQATRQSGS